MFVVTDFIHYIANLICNVYALSFWYMCMYVWFLYMYVASKLQCTCSVQLGLHFFFLWLIFSRSMACCLPSWAKKEIQSCIVFRRTQRANTVCSGYKVQGGRIRNHRGWKTTKTWWLLSGELIAITVSILSLYIIFLLSNFSCTDWLIFILNKRTDG